MPSSSCNCKWAFCVMSIALPFPVVKRAPVVPLASTLGNGHCSSTSSLFNHKDETTATSKSTTAAVYRTIHRRNFFDFPVLSKRTLTLCHLSSLGNFASIFSLYSKLSSLRILVVNLLRRSFSWIQFRNSPTSCSEWEPVKSAANNSAILKLNLSFIFSCLLHIYNNFSGKQG